MSRITVMDKMMNVESTASRKCLKGILKSSSGESLSSKGEHFISEIDKSFPYGTSWCGFTISKTSKSS